MRALSIDLDITRAAWPRVTPATRARARPPIAIKAAKRAEFYSLGLVLGYGYGSDAAATRLPSADVYRPIAGSRQPAAAQPQRGRHSLYDLLGPEFTVLGGDREAWAAAAARRGDPARPRRPG